MNKLVALYLILLTSNHLVNAQNHFYITDVNIPSFTNGKMLSNQTVEIEDERIVAIQPTAAMTIDAASVIIDGTDNYLIPGLSEMHAHIPIPEDGDDSNVQDVLFLYLANGITTIRGMLGDPYHLQLKLQVENNSFPSPRIYTSSPSLNGNTISTKEEARLKVTQYKMDGYDFLKVHPGIKRDVFDEMVKTANEVGITFSGHVPADVGIEHAIEARYATIDHLDGYIEGLVDFEKREDGGFFGVLLAQECEASLIPELVRRTKEAGIAVVPTQTLMTRWLSPKSPELMIQEPEIAYMPPAERFRWRQSKKQMLDELNYSEATYNRFINLRQQYLRQFHEAGVPILLGSDAPQVFNVPGFSIHHEMQSMVDAGLSPAEVLKSGTVNVAQFFNTPDRGSVEEGQVADLVLLRANPLDDISNTTQIESVIYRGTILTQKQIENRLIEIAIKHKSE